MRAPNRFQKESRINQSKKIRALFSAPKFWQDAPFWIRAKDQSGGFPRLAIIVSKKMVPLAVTRNYLKRLIRETFRCHAQKLPPWDYLLYWSSVEKKPDRVSVFQQLDRAWGSLGD